MNDREIPLGELGELISIATPLKIIGASDGKVLILRYDKEKHAKYANLKVSSIHIELRVVDGGNPRLEPVLTAWASNREYKRIKWGEDNV